jgi:hypothetical protein
MALDQRCKTTADGCLDRPVSAGSAGAESHAIAERRTRGNKALGMTCDKDSESETPLHREYAGPARSAAAAALPRASLSPARWTNIGAHTFPMP